MKKNTNLLIFLLAAFSETQVRIVGSIGISELVVFLVAPVVYFQDLALLRRHGFLAIINLAWLTCLGCVISSIYNQTPFPNFLRGFAACYALVAVPVVLHRLMWNNLGGFKWFIVGVSISGILTLFGFQTGVEEAMIERLGDAAESELYFGRHFASFFTLPINAFYLQTPSIIAAPLAIIPSIYTIMTTSTGRSQIMTTVGGLILVIMANRSVRRMKMMQRHFIGLLIVGFCVVIACASAYKMAAKAGILNEKAQNKYELQQKNENGGMLSLIMHGRSEVFIGLYACLHEPIFGFGPWPIDRRGYVVEFMSKYGDAESYEKLLEHRRGLAAKGIYDFLLPGHSHVITHWLCYGVLGLPYWLYVIYLMAKVARSHLSAIPQWFGYLGMLLPSMLWNVFFSPFSGRIYTSFYIACLLLVIAVGEKRIRLPPDMMIEAQKHV